MFGGKGLVWLLRVDLSEAGGWRNKTLESSDVSAPFQALQERLQVRAPAKPLLNS